MFKLLLFVLFSFIYCNGVYFKTKKAECNANKKYFANISCVLKPINWTRSILNIDGDIIGEITNAHLLAEIFYRDSSNLYKPLITQLQYNICDLLRKSNARNFLEKYAMEHFRIYTNLNHTCPFSGHLYARNFTLDEVSIPPLPLQEYKLSIKFTQTNPSAFLGSVLLYFDATEIYHKKKPHRN
ncbi:uncharacterized protein LOC132789584 [Drosophila nasuta]|uniref:uncharacterized protein LOC132789584 n=1 Tax=Drosophila nasuta TaxID=42062 RepID=UPI00295F2E9F|nr:uncharacterized protein LOC132789584 [Drosophila nasuta]